MVKLSSKSTSSPFEPGYSHTAFCFLCDPTEYSAISKMKENPNLSLGTSEESRDKCERSSEKESHIDV
jgi:hypothetical protein